MRRQEFTDILNLSNPTVKARLHKAIDAAEGIHEVKFKPTKMTRSQKQNRMWWGAVVQPVAVHLLEQGDARTVREAQELAHEMIVRDVLGVVKATNPRTGEVIERRMETHNLSADEFSIMFERGCDWVFAAIGHTVLNREEAYGLEPVRGRR